MEIGRINGYEKSTIMHIRKKHQEKKRLSKVLTFYETTEPYASVVGIKYYPKVTKKLKSVLQHHGRCGNL